MKWLASYRIILVITIVSFAAGCADHTPLPVTPHALTDGSGAKALSELPPAEQTPEMKILYVSDREPTGEAGSIKYGFGRSRGVGYGTATVSIRPDTDWKTLVERAGKPEKSEDSWLEVTNVHEGGRFTPTINLMEAGPKGLQLSAAGLATRDAEFKAAEKLLGSRLTATQSGDVYLYIHGFSNSFDDAVTRLAGVWHHLGRKGVPIAYTWPAGRGGMFGYFYDRESSEYTIYRLKQTVLLIAECPQVKRLHIIAHSRGTDVAVNALRELTLEARAAGKDPQQALKLETIILAAPDIDTEIFMQRFIIENVAASARQLVIYASPEDSALGWATWLFSGGVRVGSTQLTNLKPQGKLLLKDTPSMQLIACKTRSFATSHAYAFTNPAALSDMIMVLRDCKDAGAANGRPLTYTDPAWSLDDNYMKPGAPAKK